MSKPGLERQPGEYGYIALIPPKRGSNYRRQEVYASSSYQAQCRAADIAGIPEKKRYTVDVTLCERPGGSSVVHVPTY